MVYQKYTSQRERGPVLRRRPPPGQELFDEEGAELQALVAALHAFSSMRGHAPLLESDLRPFLRKNPRPGGGFFSRSTLIEGVRRQDGLSEAERNRLVEALRMRPARTHSGVVPVTVFTRPFPCPGQCVFCPNDLRMPKSYLSDEPGAQRAEDNGFHPYLQTWSRLEVFRALGHETAKVELLILGGTWTHYPRSYRLWFVTECFRAMNDFGCGVDGREIRAFERFEVEGAPRIPEGRLVAGSYNRQLRDHYGRWGAHARPEENLSDEALFAAHKDNEESGVRSVGLVVETRPDEINTDVLEELRRLGVTKVQLGVQSLSDEVLAKNKRGHGYAEVVQAFSLLRRFGFKVLAHAMPNLLGATLASDLDEFPRFFSSPDLRPDEMKIYPCSLLESAELMEFFERGEWQPYGLDTLLKVVEAALAATPRYCRLSRVIRDIPGTDIVEGNRLTNLRQMAEDRLKRRGIILRDIRAREIRGRQAQMPLSLDVMRYETRSSEECFLEVVDAQDHLLGFARVSLPRNEAPVPELRRAALLRELHVYGTALRVGEKTSAVQHQGIGKWLVREACKLASSANSASSPNPDSPANFERLAVISAVGTRGYYRRLGFVDGSLYQHFKLGAQEDDVHTTSSTAMPAEAETSR